VKDLNRCPPKKGGCGKQILLGVKPLELETPSSWDRKKVEEFCQKVQNICLDEKDQARFLIDGRELVILTCQVVREKYFKLPREFYKEKEKIDFENYFNSSKNQSR